MSIPTLLNMEERSILISKVSHGKDRLKPSDSLSLFIVLKNGKFHDVCYSPDGKKGLCMFQFECKNSGGTPLSLCRSGFQFGACCSHNETSNEVTSTSTTTTTKDPIIKDRNVIDYHTTHGKL